MLKPIKKKKNSEIDLKTKDIKINDKKLKFNMENINIY